MSDQFDDRYFTLKDYSESLYKVKGSKHFGYAIPVTNTEKVKLALENIKKEHHSARHHCYAYRLGADHKEFRANDDGEPSNAAGKPILGQIEHFDLTNVLIIVVRYFGGTKLGVGGLIDAYRTAAREAILAGDIVEKHVKTYLRIRYEYESMNDIMRIMKDFDLPQHNQEFGIRCFIDTSIRASKSEELIERIEDLRGPKHEITGVY